MKLQLRFFRSSASLTLLIAEYFNSVGVDASALTPKKGKAAAAAQKSSLKPKPTTKRTIKREYDPPTITGLALHLGFNSLDEFEHYEIQGRFATVLKRARLIIAAAYEKKLHNTHYGGAVFALKELGWKDKPEDKSYAENSPVVTVKIIASGPEPSATEKEVTL